MTNGDRIRSMTNEELIDFFCIDIIDHPCPPDTSCCPSNEKFVSCVDCWKFWLKQEFTDNGQS